MKGKSMRELREWDQLRTFFDRRLIEALRHPVREHLLAVFNERIASATEIGEEIGADVSSFYHHVEELERLGFIERVATRHTKGGLEHLFEAKRTAYFDNEAWLHVPASVRENVAVRSIQKFIDEAATACALGTLSKNGDEHVSWSPIRLDEEGWRLAISLFDETLKELLEIRRQSDRRLLACEESGKAVSVGMFAFEVPPERPGGP